MSAIKLLKYHKPVGVLSTTFRDIPGNIVDKGMLSPEFKRLVASPTSRGPIVPIGRLDKDSRGLLLLTNSEQIIARLLRTSSDNGDSSEEDNYGSNYPKVYEVRTHRRITDDQIEKLRNGVVISTFARNRSGTKNVRKTLPIGLERLVDDIAPSDNHETTGDSFDNSRKLLFTLREGRNRQIRKMVGKFGHAVEDLKRVSFGGITLSGIEQAGMMAPLTDEELLLLGIRKLL